MAMLTKDRVQKHRSKLRAERFRRLEVWISTDVVANLREVATYRDSDLRTIVQEAFSTYLSMYSGVLEVRRKQ